MPNANTAALDFLKTRRSRPFKTLTTPLPNREEVMDLLTIAARSPDHGKLVPWRFIVLDKAALNALVPDITARAQAAGRSPTQVRMATTQYETGNLAVAVIEVQQPSEHIPPFEQTLSAGAVCLALLNAAHAAGWGANWLSGWASHDRGFMAEGLGLSDNERVAGIIHIGTETTVPEDRPRPDVESITTWKSA